MAGALWSSSPVIASDSRAAHYGDGLFETLLVRGGKQLILHEAHFDRLRHGCERLGIEYPSAGVDAAVARALSAAPQHDAVLKLIISRRPQSARGYGADLPSNADVYAALYPAPVDPFCATSRLRVGVCDARASIEPTLAGMKHLNRLPQVLAASEVLKAGWDEGIMLSAAGFCVSATAANLFVVRNGCVYTPRVDQCGVAGTMRSTLMGWMDVAETEITLEALEDSDEVFLTNSVRGIREVGRIAFGDKEVDYPAGPVTASVRATVLDRLAV